MSNTLVVLWNQFEFWFHKKPDGFYKFLKPCEHRLYREGDSWCEQLGISENTFRKHFKKIGVSYASKQAFLEVDDPFQGKPYACYFDRLKKMTYFFRNAEVASTLTFEKILSLDCVSDCVSVCVSNIQNTNNYKHNSSPLPPCQDMANETREEGRFKKAVKGRVGEGAISPLAQAMYDIWKEVTGEHIHTPTLTATFAGKLLEALAQFFHNSLKAWKDYCKTIASSAFLMGKVTTFKAWLIWVVRSDVVAKIKEGAFGLKPWAYEEEVPEEDFERKANDLVESLSPSAAIRQKLFQLKQAISARSFISWFNQCQIQEGEKDWPRLVVKRSFCHDYIRDTYGAILQEIGFRMQQGII